MLIFVDYCKNMTSKVFLFIYISILYKITKTINLK